MQQAPAALENPRLTEEILRQMGPDGELQTLFEDPSRARFLGMQAADRGDHSKALFFLLAARGQDPRQPDVDRTILDLASASPPPVDPVELFAGSPSPVPGSLTETEKALWRQRALDRLADFYRKGLYEEGLNTIAAMQTAGSPGEYTLLKAVFQEKLGREQEAMGQYRLALQAGDAEGVSWAPGARDHLLDLMVHHAIQAYEQGQYGRALSLLQEARNLDPQRKDVAFNLGCIYFQEKNAQKALDAFSAYIALAEEDSPRKILTERAMDSLRKQIAATPGVRYDQEGVAVDLVFEQPLSLGALLVPDNVAATEKPEARALMDSVLLVPYMEQDLEGSTPRLEESLSAR
jgi:tetratricopeptide (TPR) repeat protein